MTSAGRIYHIIRKYEPGKKAANQLTNRAVDPLSKMPEFKVAAVRVERAGGHTDTTDARDMALHGDRP